MVKGGEAPDCGSGSYDHSGRWFVLAGSELPNRALQSRSQGQRTMPASATLQLFLGMAIPCMEFWARRSGGGGSYRYARTGASLGISREETSCSICFSFLLMSFQYVTPMFHLLRSCRASRTGCFRRPISRFCCTTHIVKSRSLKPVHFLTDSTSASLCLIMPCADADLREAANSTARGVLSFRNTWGSRTAGVGRVNWYPAL